LRADWGFLTGRAWVLLCIAHDPGVQLRGTTARTGVTDLTEAGYVVAVA
jgi:hypothetical protein